MFDTPAEPKSVVEFDVECPEPWEDWRVFAITGASGTGKSSVGAKYAEALGATVFKPVWNDRAIVDEGNWPEGTTVEAIKDALVSVGFSSPPAWLRPHKVLSNGEQFRANLARALIIPDEVIVIDEFTSLVDRVVARTCAIAVRRAIDNLWEAGKKKRLVPISCHNDYLDAIKAECVLDMDTQTLARGCLRRGVEIDVEIFPVHTRAWALFAPHHYLDRSLHKGAKCFVATVEGRPAAICCVLHAMGFSGRFRITRVVTLPDYQGIGIGSRLMDAVAERYVLEGKSISIVASHPAVLRHCSRSSQWAFKDQKAFGNKQQGRKAAPVRKSSSTGRPIATFIFVGEKGVSSNPSS